MTSTDGMRMPVRDELPDDVAEVLNKSILVDGKPLPIFGILAHNKAMLLNMIRFGAVFLNRSTIPFREREIIVMRAAWHAQGVYEFGHHVKHAIAAGLTHDEIARLTHNGHADWSDDDAVLIDLVDEIEGRANVSDETWAKLQARFDEDQLVELLLIPSYYRMVCTFLNATAIPVEPGVPGWPDSAERPRR